MQRAEVREHGHHLPVRLSDFPRSQPPELTTETVALCATIEDSIFEARDRMRLVNKYPAASCMLMHMFACTQLRPQALSRPLCSPLTVADVPRHAHVPLFSMASVGNRSPFFDITNSKSSVVRLRDVRRAS